jgi:hypothetical protein
VLPGYLVCVLPKLNLSVVRARGNNVLRGVEADPVAAALMTVKYFDALNLDPDKGAHVLGFRQLFPEDREVPNPDS